MFDLAQIAHEWIAADMGRAMIAGAVLLGAILRLPFFR